MSSAAKSPEEREEREHFVKVVSAFRSYKADSLARLQKTLHNLKQISLEQQKLLEKHGYQANIGALESCVELNYRVLQDIAANVDNMFENHATDVDGDAKTKTAKTLTDDQEKVQSTLKQLARDWSAEGREERQQCYQPILDELCRLHPDAADRANLRVLVPGAGLGRLAFEIASRGFECQGNEFSLYMLFASNYVLNKTKYLNCFKIYPWIHQFSNQLSRDAMQRSVAFPDLDPNGLPETAQFSMTAGDFLEVYSDGQYRCSQDVVATCFFIDCAHNVVDFIQLIHQILKPGGRWINFGPLLYHFADMPREWSIEPSYDVVKKMIEQVGFEYEMERTEVPATYCQNAQSMLQYQYKCVFFTCKRL